MDDGPVTTLNGYERGLTVDEWSNVQTIVQTGFPWLAHGTALFIYSAARRPRWVPALRRVAPITCGHYKSEQPAEWAGPNSVEAWTKTQRAAAIAFTATGLEKLGVPAKALDSFATAFREGMHQTDRRRRLGDTEDVIAPGGIVWTGNAPPLRGTEEEEEEAYVLPDEAYVAPEARLVPHRTVHALLLLYAERPEDLAMWVAEVERELQANDAQIVRSLPLEMRFEGSIAREHFGFADGISQPLPYRPGSDDPNDERYKWHGVPVGDIVMGYENSHAEVPPGPIVEELTPDGRPDPAAAVLPQDRQTPMGFRNLGLNGSYLVVRELSQDVAKFWESMGAAAERLRRQGGSMADVDGDWLAARVVGRDRDGKCLCPAGMAAAEDDGFGFHTTDARGTGCPVGSHIRRANPRDGLAPDAFSAPGILAAVNNHRILRRGRKYGETIADRMVDDGKDRGLLFMCLNTDIARQFEFVQQTWLLNSSFASLVGETDPLLGPKGPLTIPQEPLRQRLHVETFVRLTGGEYFFLPSLPGLNYLCAL